MSNVNHPSHYNQGKIEVIEFIEDKKLGFHLGNSVKYICRAGKKNPAKETEDLKKAIWYLERKIELLSGEQLGTKVRRPNDMNERKPLAAPKVPENNKEMLEKFFNPSKTELPIMVKQVRKEGYVDGYKAGFDDGQAKNRGGAFNPDIHVDNSLYGYGYFDDFQTLGKPEGRLTISRQPGLKSLNLKFFKITPMEEK